MDAFEQVVSELLWMEGYWVRTSVKVNLTKEDKEAIELPSSPRWELDILAYKARENMLRVVECKSYLDSYGVRLSAFDGTDPKGAERYKMFNKPQLRAVVFNRLRRQFVETGACREDPDVRLALACGKIREADRSRLRDLFAARGWDLWDEAWLRQRLRRMSDGGYENQVSAVVAKLLLRGQVE